MKNLNKQLQERIGELIGKDYFKLEFGCKYLDKIDNAIYTIIERYDLYDDISVGKNEVWSIPNYRKGYVADFRLNNEELFEIIGTEPTLNDLLMALDKEDIQYLLYNNGIDIFIEDDDGLLPKERIKFNISLSLFNQTEETKQKLIELLK